MTTLKTHVMVDIETLGNAPQNGVIIAMGAIAFNMDEDIPYPTDDEFSVCDTASAWYVPIDPWPQEKDYKFVIEPATLRWWLEPSRVNQLAEFLCSPQRRSIGMAWEMWLRWLQEQTVQASDRQLWSHGVTFDCMHLSQKWPHVMNASFDEVCSFRNMRDTRTLFAAYEANYNQSPYPSFTRQRHHHPLEDAWVQAVAVQNAWKGVTNG